MGYLVALYKKMDVFTVAFISLAYGYVWYLAVARDRSYLATAALARTKWQLPGPEINAHTRR